MEQPKADFSGLVISLAAGVSAALNEVESLRTGKPSAAAQEGGAPTELTAEEAQKQAKATLTAARQLIDTLVMLEEKTKGNLSDQEQQLIRGALSELRIQYVRLATPTN